MSNEELLEPRYKVIADYPNNPYKVGDILFKPYGFNHFRAASSAETRKKNCGIDLRNNGINENELLQNPHLFKKIEWWEDRDEDDLPKYIMVETNKKVVIGMNFGLRFCRYEHGFKDGFYFIISGIKHGCLPEYCSPSTKEEYEEYINSIKKNNIMSFRYNEEEMEQSYRMVDEHAIKPTKFNFVDEEDFLWDTIQLWEEYKKDNQSRWVSHRELFKEFVLKIETWQYPKNQEQEGN